MIIKYPLGAYDLETGKWYKNNFLTMSEDEQHRINLQNGYSCEHKHNLNNCPYCKKT